MPSVCPVIAHKEGESVEARPASATGSMADETCVIKACITALDKKIRNLEKRKNKLDSYQQKNVKGQQLNQDQKEALSKYEVVAQNLEFAHEIVKQFQAMAVDVEKQQRKQARREKIQRQQESLAQMVELLKVQSVLSYVSNETLSAENSPGLSAEDITELTEFKKKVELPLLADEYYEGKIERAAEYMLGYLGERDEAAGDAKSSAKLKSNVGKLISSRFFIKSAEPIAEAAAEPEPATEESDKPTDSWADQVDEAEALVETSENETAAPGRVTESEVKPDVISEVISSHPQEQVNQFNPVSVTSDNSAHMTHPNPAHITQPGLYSQHGGLVPGVPHEAYNQSFFSSTLPVSYLPQHQPQQTQPKTKDVREIVNAIQGSYDFLQDSVIDNSGNVNDDSSFPCVRNEVSRQSTIPPVTIAPGNSHVPYHPGGYVPASYPQAGTVGADGSTYYPIVTGSNGLPITTHYMMGAYNASLQSSAPFIAPTSNASQPSDHIFYDSAIISAQPSTSHHKAEEKSSEAQPVLSAVYESSRLHNTADQDDKKLNPNATEFKSRQGSPESSEIGDGSAPLADAENGTETEQNEQSDRNGSGFTHQRGGGDNFGRFPRGRGRPFNNGRGRGGFGRQYNDERRGDGGFDGPRRGGSFRGGRFNGGGYNGGGRGGGAPRGREDFRSGNRGNFSRPQQDQ